MDNFDKKDNPNEIVDVVDTQPENDTKPKKSAFIKTLNILGVVIVVLLLPILIIDGVLMYKSITNPDAPADFMGYMPFVSGADNMTEFDGDDLIIMKQLEADEVLESGNIICYWYNDGHEEGVVIERITDVVEEDGAVRYTAKADTAEEESLLEIDTTQIIGVYHRHIDDLGTFVLFMQTTKGILTCVVLPICVLFLAFHLIDRKKYKDALREAQAAQNNNANIQTDA